MITEVSGIEIKDIQFVGNSIMLLLLSLSNDRTFIVSLDKFEAIIF